LVRAKEKKFVCLSLFSGTTKENAGEMKKVYTGKKRRLSAADGQGA